MQRMANNINMLKSHCYVTSNLQFVTQKYIVSVFDEERQYIFICSTNAVILTRYFVTL